MCLRRGPPDGVHHSHRHQSGGLLPLLPHPQTGPWTHPLWCDWVAAAGWTVGFHGHPQVSGVRIPMSPGKTWGSVSRVCFAEFMRESRIVWKKKHFFFIQNLSLSKILIISLLSLSFVSFFFSQTHYVHGIDTLLHWRWGMQFSLSWLFWLESSLEWFVSHDGTTFPINMNCCTSLVPHQLEPTTGDAL